MKQQRYTLLGGKQGTIKHCWELLTDTDGYQARCLVPAAHHWPIA